MEVMLAICAFILEGSILSALTDTRSDGSRFGCHLYHITHFIFILLILRVIISLGSSRGKASFALLL